LVVVVAPNADEQKNLTNCLKQPEGQVLLQQASTTADSISLGSPRMTNMGPNYSNANSVDVEDKCNQLA